VSLALHLLAALLWVREQRPPVQEAQSNVFILLLAPADVGQAIRDQAAAVDRSMSVCEDSYTAPDGVIISRKRIGNATICRRSGNVTPLGMRGMVMGSEAGDIECPKGRRGSGIERLRRNLCLP
jgi:hypothetical protein